MNAKQKLLGVFLTGILEGNSIGEITDKLEEGK